MKVKSFFILLIAIATSFIATSCGVGPAVKELKKYNNPTSRYWIDFIKENGINAIDDDGDTLLLTAVIENNLPLAKACIKSGADVNLFPHYKNPALWVAVSYNNVEMVKFLLDNKAKVVSDDYDMIRSSLAFDEKRETEIFDLLFSKVSIDDLNYDLKGTSYFDTIDFDFSGISMSQRKACGEVLDRLLKKGYRVNSADLYRIMIFMKGNDTENVVVCKKVIEENVDLIDFKVVFGNMNRYMYNWSYDETRNDSVFEYFKYYVDLANDISDCNDKIVGIVKEMLIPNHFPINDSLKKLKEIMPVLLEKGFDMQTWKLTQYCFSSFEYDFVSTIESLVYYMGQMEEYENSPDPYDYESAKDYYQDVLDYLNTYITKMINKDALEYLLNLGANISDSRTKNAYEAYMKIIAK